MQSNEVSSFIINKRQGLFVSFFFLFSFCSQSVYALEWERLLHYRSGKSEIENQEFFISKKGRKNSQAELTAFKNSIESKNEKWSKTSTQCQFPLRYIYLLRNKIIEGSESDLKKCPELQAFLSRMGTGRVSVVFSSYFMGNPGSIFGHTLLKVSKAEYLTQKEEDPLLSYGINYAASAGDERGLFYALKGLLGFYDGEFSAIPYYYKVREYNDYESRDLWVYDLNLSERQKKDLVYHIWELGKAKDSYYFFNKNCSYHLLKSLEVILPTSIKLSSHYNLFTIPSQTVKRLYNTPGLVSNIHYRPSLKSRLDQKMKGLKRREQKKVIKAVKKIHKKKETPALSDFSLGELDASIDLYDYYYFKKSLSDTKEYLKSKRPLLVERSKRDKSTELKKFESKAPHSMHQASFFGLSYAHSENSKQLNLNLRPAFHSYYEDPSGLMPYGEVVLGELSLGFFENKQTGESEFNLNSAKWIKASDHSPVQTFKVPLAWSFELSSNRPLFNESMLEHSALLETGLSFKLSGLNFIYGTTFIRASFLDNGGNKLFHEEGLKLGLRLKIVRSLFILSFVEAFLKNSVQEDFEWDVNYGGEFGFQSTLTRNWSFFLLHEERFKERRTTAALRRYF